MPRVNMEREILAALQEKANATPGVTIDLSTVDLSKVDISDFKFITMNGGGFNGTGMSSGTIVIKDTEEFTFNNSGWARELAFKTLLRGMAYEPADFIDDRTIKFCANNNYVTLRVDGLTADIDTDRPLIQAAFEAVTNYDWTTPGQFVLPSIFTHFNELTIVAPGSAFATEVVKYGNGVAGFDLDYFEMWYTVELSTGIFNTSDEGSHKVLVIFEKPKKTTVQLTPVDLGDFITKQA